MSECERVMQPRRGEPSHPCWLEVDLDAVGSNVRAVRALVGPETDVAAVVKAEAYGLGALAVARTALAAGASWLAVARVEEAVQLRQAGLNAPILNLAFTDPEEAASVVRYRITPAIADLNTLEAVAAAVGPGRRFPIHLKVDTGLTRYGALESELGALITALERFPNLQVDGLFSHFAAADEADLAFARAQLRQFQRATRTVEDAGHAPRLRHIANSAGTLALPAARLDLVRVGLALSGHFPSADVPRCLALRPAVTLRARLARVYDLPAGASVGYNRTFRSTRPLRAGLVPVGYADGLPRSHSNVGQVLVHGRRAGLLGRVSMDQCVVDLTACPDARPGDAVTIIGEQGSERVSLDEYAAWDDTIPHEALCRIGARVPRCYIRDGQIRTVNWLGRQARQPDADQDERLVACSP